MKAWNQTTQLKRTNGVMFSPKRIAWFAVVVLAAVTPLQAQTPLGSEFTYQGKLDLLGTALNDTADFEFTLWDAEFAGNMIDAVVPVSNVTVVDGQFTVEIDFGVIAFNGDKRWLEIAVRSPAGGGMFTTLDPRQPLTAAPYALQTRGIFVNNAGNVGIGTTAPGAKLGVLGEIRVQSKITSSQGDLTLSGGGSGVRIDLDEDGGSSDAFTISDTGVERFRVEGNTGNVGIGVVNPATKLEVDGIVTATAFVGDGSGLTGISADDADADPANELQTLAGVLGQGNDAGGADMLNLGNVGIGNSNPNAKLKVTGTEPSQSTLLLNYTGFFSPGNYPPALKIDGGGYDSIAGSVTGIEVDLSSATAPSKYAAIFKGGNVGIGTTSPSATLDVVGTTELNGDVTINSNLTVDTDTLFVDGTTRNVGIGTASPNATLETAGNIVIRNPRNNGALLISPSAGGFGVNPELVIQSAEAGAGSNTSFHISRNAIFQTSDDTYQYIDNDFDDEATKIEFESDGDLKFSSAQADGAATTVSWTDNVVIKGGSGNVGIGTNSPSTKLDVNGTVTANNLDVNGTVTATAFVGDGSGLTNLSLSLVIVRGQITGSDGSINASKSTTGVSSSKLSGDAHYLVSFPAGAFSGEPIVTVTAFDPTNGRLRVAILESVSTDDFSVFIRNQEGVRFPARFNFIAIGER